MTRYRAVETVRADQLHAGDVVRMLGRLTAGRAAVESIRSMVDGQVWLTYAFSSQRCNQRCYDDPIRCPHMNGDAGGGSGTLPADELVDRYTGEEVMA